MTTHHTLFISDLHLDAQNPSITHAFFYFLEHVALKADALYILGDLFESYIGDDDNTPFIQSITHALSKLNDDNIPVFIMHGNRDFLIGKNFANNAGAILISDPILIDLYHQKILLMHGDSLCTQDKNHQRFRKITQNKITQKIFLSLPLSFRKKIANQLRQESTQQNYYKSAEIMDVSEEAAAAVLKKYSAQKIIHGHTHRPMITQNRIVLGMWHEHGNYLKACEDGKIEMIAV